MSTNAVVALGHNQPYNQSLVPVKLSSNIISNQFFTSERVNDHVSTNNKDVGIPNKKDVDISRKIDVDMPQNKDVKIPSVHVNIPLSQTNKPNYKLISLYHYQNIARRK